MHDKVSLLDGVSFWLSSRNSFQGAKSIVMQTSVVFGLNFRRRGAKVSELAPVVRKNPGFRQYYVINLGISYHIYESFSAKIVEPREI